MEALQGEKQARDARLAFAVEFDLNASAMIAHLLLQFGPLVSAPSIINRRPIGHGDQVRRSRAAIAWRLTGMRADQQSDGISGWLLFRCVLKP